MESQLRQCPYHMPLTYLAHVRPRVAQLDPLQPQDPVDGLCAVDDLEAPVRGEERVAVRQEAEIPLPHK